MKRGSSTGGTWRRIFRTSPSGCGGGVQREAGGTRVHPEGGRAARPLGVPALEDKIVQRAVVEALHAIYEADFRGFSYGFRPRRSPHQALDALTVGITTKKVNWVLDADIQSFFDTVEHGWLLRFLEHRVADRRVLRLIQKWLSAGVLDEGQRIVTEVGTVQGGSISPLLANVYLHYVFDLWVHQWRQRHAHGDVIVVRYADDFVMGFQRREEAEQCLADLRTRCAQFGLTLHRRRHGCWSSGALRPATGARVARANQRASTFSVPRTAVRRPEPGSSWCFRRTMRTRVQAKLEGRQNGTPATHAPTRTRNSARMYARWSRGTCSITPMPHELPVGVHVRAGGGSALVADTLSSESTPPLVGAHAPLHITALGSSAPHLSPIPA